MHIYKLLMRLFLGVDMSIGVLLYVFLSVVFNQEFNIYILLSAILCSHLPDADMIPYLLLHKWLGPIGSNGASGHWPYGHHPVVVVPLVSAVGWALAPVGEEGYIATLFASCVLAHFVHDSTQEQGLHWFSPFSWKQYTCKAGFPRRVPDEYVRGFYKKIAGKSKENDSVGYEVRARLPSFGTKVWLLSVAALLSLLLFALL